MKLLSVVIAFFFLVFHTVCFSQQTGEAESKPSKNKNGKGFTIGLYFGSYFANKHTAKLYDGYGYDADGKRNTFSESFMYRRIVLEYGGYGYGQTDQVAQALNVNHGEWSFDETDMPINMKYNPAFLIGAQVLYGITKKDALLLNANASKLTLNGNFTIVITTPPIGPQQPGYQDIKTFSITGGEQRLTFQLGYRRILGEDEMFNCFIEAGPSLTMTKYLKNQATINNLQIDLGHYYNTQYYPTYRASYLSGIGLGVFAGFGLHLTANSKLSLQLLYSPSYDYINIGEEPKRKLQHAIGIRAFYSI